MAIARPITKTIISTTAWGIPVTDAVNANTTDIAALKPTAWVNLTLLNGWVHAGSPSSPVRYRKVGDIVYIEGAIKSGTMGVSLFNVPVGFRPSYQIQRSVYNGTGNICGLAMTTGGDLFIQYGNNSFVDIGMSYPTT